MDDEAVKAIIAADVWMMEILSAAQRLELPDWWICAGFVRSKIWDSVHGFQKRTPMQDIDVIFYDRKHVDVTSEKKYERELSAIMPHIPWSVKNEARMHVKSNMPPYTSSVDAISKFPETATALGVKLDHRNRLVLTAPHGLQDVVACKVRPTDFFIVSKERRQIYNTRISNKNWSAIWPKVELQYI